jgi:diaminopimelate decarboxylase
MFIGPGKTRREIIGAAQMGVGHFVVDNETELSVLALDTNVREVIVRVNPLFEASGAKLSMSGGKPKQFGVDRPQITEFISLARAMGIAVVGLHYYLGTRYLNASDIVDNTRLIIDDAAEIARENDLSVRFLDMGGGFGVPYFPGEAPLDMALLERGLQACIQEANRIFPDATLAFESGRYLTAEAGRLLLTVLAKKTSYGTTFCVCDGGTNLNLAVIGTGSLGKRNFPSRVVSMSQHDVQTASDSSTVTVTGPLCTPDDTILKSVEWEINPRPGDVVVIERVGAYGPTASPHSFLGHRFPTEVLI